MMKLMRRSLAGLLMVAAMAAGCGEGTTDPPTDNPRTFTYVRHTSAPAVTSVAVRGSFNEWGETAMTQQADGTWSVTIANLPSGEVTFKYFFNGETWAQNMCADPNWGNPPGGPVTTNITNCVDDGFGGQNAVRNIP